MKVDKEHVKTGKGFLKESSERLNKYFPDGTYSAININSILHIIGNIDVLS